MYVKILKKLACGLMTFGLVANVQAATQPLVTHKNNEVVKIGRPSSLTGSAHLHKTEKSPHHKEWKLSSTGGLSYIHPNDARYWFELSGVIRLDETLFMSNYRNKKSDFANGGNIRAIETYFEGGVGEFLAYTLTLRFNGNTVLLGDTWVSYAGFLDNNQVFVGRVPGNWFGLDNSNSTSWNPFLERSLPSLAFYPGDGLGIMTDFWWENGAITLSAMQADIKTALNVADPSLNYNANGNDVFVGLRDRWKGTLRLTVSPLHDEGDVWHFGISGGYREVISTINGMAVNNIVGFSAYPAARVRNTTSLLNTTYTNVANQNVSIRANNVRLFNVEAARQIGPFMLEGEYTNVFVHSVGNRLGTLRFDGWNIQTRYLLTGESHAYNVRDGNFGSINPVASYGALELAARYDFIQLNDKNIRGGSEHNVTVGLNWFINKTVRLSANYIRASIHPANDAQKRNLDILGMRLQVRFK